MLATGALAVAISVTGIVNVGRYLDHEEWHGIGAQNHLVEIGRNLHGRVEDYDRIYIDAPGLFPYLYVSVFSGMPPKEFQRTPREGIVTAFGWEKFHRFGRFHFTSAEEARQAWRQSAQTETWLLVTADGERVEFRPQQHAQFRPR